ncbi:MAG: 4Fe-4S dicluster domain-containing protein [Deltaproteobacteria bacterium]|nr:4Fe-4S dicluster domain-containing protein [Deltaproteobacteria bacterium]
MADRVIKKSEFIELIDRLLESYRVYAPVRQQDMTNFQEISAADQVDLSLANTTMSPKSIMLPQSETMFEFNVDKTSDQAAILRETEKDLSPRLIFGIRPCDAKAFQLLDLNFDTVAYKDPWWVARRKTTTLMGLACNAPCSTCFCTSVGSGPFAPEGLDLLLVDVDDYFLIQVITEKGEKLLNEEGIETEAAGAMKQAALASEKSSLQSIKSVVSAASLAQHDTKTLFDSDFWEEVQFACINCGVCTFVCPTCWCFDIQDEVHKDNGIRLRNWDSCMFPLFTLHGSGHNPRAQKLQRLRQRFMHKLKYFVDKYDKGVACVGCGRCVQQCPVNIDIREVFRLMND